MVFVKLHAYMTARTHIWLNNATFDYRCGGLYIDHFANSG
uniref:Uncharacterized protein n=1 Tax=Arundo donax TaxID=35708 RepID=A0A0A9FJR7_ARUDO